MLLVDTYPDDIKLKYFTISCISIDDDHEELFLNLKEVEKYGFKGHMTDKIYGKISEIIKVLKQLNKNKQGQYITDVEKLFVAGDGKMSKYIESYYCKCTKRLGNVKYYRLEVCLTIEETYPNCKKVIPYTKSVHH